MSPNNSADAVDLEEENTAVQTNLADFQVFRDHVDLSKRLRKTLYYAKWPTTDRPSLPLSEIAVELFSKSVPRKGLEVLDMHYAASVSRRACVSPCSMMLAMVYLEQLRCRNPEYLQAISSCDLFLISMLVASKYLYEDESDVVFNGEWAASANIDVKDLNRLEREFLAAMNWQVFVEPDAFYKVLRKIEAEIVFHEAAHRGWLSYTDAWVLSNRLVVEQCWQLLVDNFIKVIAVSTVAYTAAVLTLVGAAATANQILGPHTASLMIQQVWNRTSSPAVTPTLFPDAQSMLATTDDAHLPSDVPPADLDLGNEQVRSRNACSIMSSWSSQLSGPPSFGHRPATPYYCRNQADTAMRECSSTNKSDDYVLAVVPLPSLSIRGGQVLMT